MTRKTRQSTLRSRARRSLGLPGPGTGHVYALTAREQLFEQLQDRAPLGTSPWDIVRWVDAICDAGFEQLDDCCIVDNATGCWVSPITDVPALLREKQPFVVVTIPAGWS